MARASQPGKVPAISTSSIEEAQKMMQRTDKEDCSQSTLETVESSFRSLHIQNESSSVFSKEASDQEDDEGAPPSSLSAISRGDCFLLPEESFFDGGGGGLGGEEVSPDFLPEEEDPAFQWQKERRTLGFEAQSHIELFDDGDNPHKPNKIEGKEESAEFSPTAARRSFMRRDDSSHQAQIFSLEDPFSETMFPETPNL
mmetsp:Transcript_2047/g.4146  ORF Transcript_2047/g.4146 Transcript_2047/m.4146 type:complete len:199 (+) Transcript_2047:135-731(+)